MKNYKSKFKTAGVLVAVFIFSFFLFIWLQKDSVQAQPLDDFAKCLADKKVVMYGAEWCPHCQTQKKMFGDSFQHIPYVECPRDPQRCLAVGIEAYPTWIMPSGERMAGEQSLETLSQASSCLLEKSNIKN